MMMFRSHYIQQSSFQLVLKNQSSSSAFLASIPFGPYHTTAYTENVPQWRPVIQLYTFMLVSGNTGNVFKRAVHKGVTEIYVTVSQCCSFCGF